MLLYNRALVLLNGLNPFPVSRLEMGRNTWIISTTPALVRLLVDPV